MRIHLGDKALRTMEIRNLSREIIAGLREKFRGVSTKNHDPGTEKISLGGSLITHYLPSGKSDREIPA